MRQYGDTECSQWNRQKQAIARSLLVKNPILFLDEPTVKLDAKGAEAVQELVMNSIISRQPDTRQCLS